ncbi:sporulation protein [Nocardia sp. NPDC005998]|uniref:sporulation protein n=1 Tax=Nocardia sp. NPDC005998 TaxID=3156894 RepID=UPI00339EFB6F
MNVTDVLATAKDSMTAKRVFADPVERDGTTVIAAAAIIGGGGGGVGTKEGQEGSGGGFGMDSKPVGAYVIKDGKVHWQPAVDINRLITVVGIVAVTALLVGARIAKLQAH